MHGGKKFSLRIERLGWLEEGNKTKDDNFQNALREKTIGTVLRTTLEVISWME
jgi:hypothetical protein